MRPTTDSPWQAMGLGEEPRWFQEGGYTGGLSSTEIGGGGTNTLSAGTLLQDRAGNVWRSYTIKGAPWLELVNRVKFTGTARRPLASAMKQVGNFFLTETGRALELQPDGTFRGLAQYETETVFPQMGAPASAPAYSSTRQAQLDEQAFQRERDAADFQRTQQLEEARAANQRRQQLMGDLRALSETAANVRNDYRARLMALESETRNILGETLGKDVVRGALRGQGVLPMGATPMEGYRTATAAVGQQAGTRATELAAPLPAPNLGADEAGLQAQMPQYQQAAQPQDLPQLPTASPFVGLAEGGTLMGSPPQRNGGMHAMPGGGMMRDEEMMAGGGMGGMPGAQMGTRKQAYLVGEGATPVEPGTEVAIVDSMMGTTEIIPLGGGAQEGATFGGFTFEPATVQQSLAPVYESLGFSATPFMGGAGLSREQYGRLGVRPQLVRSPSDTTVFYVDSAGRRRPLTFNEFQEAKFNFGDVAFLTPESLASIPLGGAQPRAGGTIEPGVSGRRFPASPGPLYIREGPGGLKGLALFMPRTIAALWPRLSASTRTVIQSALGLENFSADDIEEEIRFFSPRGTGTVSGAAMLG